MQPLTSTRPLGQCPVANQPLMEAQQAALRAAGFTRGATVSPGRSLFYRGDAWLSPAALAELKKCRHPVALFDGEGEILAGVLDAPVGHAGSAILAPGRIARVSREDADSASFLLRYPWDLLRLNEILVGAITRSRIAGTIHQGAVIDGTLVTGPGTVILPGVYVEGKVSIGRDCRIGPNCYLRGHTSIGDGCHIGQSVEIKNSILMDDVWIAHLSYCGDSIVGSHTKFGAGCVTANYRHDAQIHRSMIGGKLVPTGRLKFGAIVGDGVHLGIHTGIYPGRKIWPGVCTRPGTMVERDLH